MLVLDYSAGKPGAAAIKRAGYGGAVRYIGFPSRTKCTSRAELADFTRHGLGMALVYEDHASDWLNGFTGGRAAGSRARSHANQIGFPSDRPIYMAVDRDVVTGAQFDAMVRYLRGAAEALGGPALTGVYGEHDVCVRAQQAGVASWFWQCRAWSGTPVRLFAGRHLYQRVGTVRVGGIDCDINDVLQPDWGQHDKEDDMQLTDRVDWDQINALGPAYLGHKLLGTWQLARANRAELAGLRAAVDKLAGAVGGDDLSAEELRAAVKAGVAEALAEGTVDVDITIAGRPS